MVGLVIGIVVVAGAFVLRARPATLGMIALALWVLVPNVVSSQVGLTFGWHPATLVALIGLAVSFADRPKRWTGYASFGVTFTLIAGLALMLLSFSQDATGYRGQFVAEQIIAAVAVFLLLIAGFRQDPRVRYAFRAVFLALATANAVLVLAQSAASRMFPYESFFTVTTWYQLEAGTRYSGTFDHPLTLGMFLACAAWMTGGMKSGFWRFVLAALFTVATLPTLSRTASVVAIAALIAVVLIARTRFLLRIVLIVLLAASATALWAAFQGTTLYTKFLNDGGSAAARDAAWDIFFRNTGQYIFLGGGVGASGELTLASGSRTSLESAFAMYSVDFGLVPTVLFFAAMVFTIIGGLRARRGGLFLAAPAIAALFMVQTFSSIATMSAASTILWATVAYSARVTPGRRSPVSVTRGDHPEQRDSPSHASAPQAPSLPAR